MHLAAALAQQRASERINAQTEPHSLLEFLFSVTSPHTKILQVAKL